ncbi:MAG: hypothetical protein O9343_06820 [Burkholderiaceae bacterium]|nr:hypothetical protein [Burkholderiaceae bacterium]
MLQTAIRFDTAPATAVGGDRTAFEIGWDHARHALVPPATLLGTGHPVGQGWQAAQAVFGRRTWPARPAVRQWLALRLAAWQAGEPFDLDQLNPQHLAQIAATRCPVRRAPLGGAPGTADAAVVLRLNEAAAWAAGHLVTLSAAAAAAMQGVDAEEARRRARAAEQAGQPVQGLDSAGWWRVAALRGFATALPFATAAQLPLAVLPPNRVRLLGAAQGLQALVTQAFAAPGWAARCAAIAALLPAHTLRHDFNLFVGAMAPRVLAAPADGTGLRDALEDAWLHERVQRRWQHFVLSLGEAGTEALLERVAAMPQPGRHVLQLSLPQAVEAWQLPAAPAPSALRRVAGRGARGGRAMAAATTIRPALPCPRPAALPA